MWNQGAPEIFRDLISEVLGIMGVKNCLANYELKLVYINEEVLVSDCINGVVRWRERGFVNVEEAVFLILVKDRVGFGGVSARLLEKRLNKG